MICSPPYSVTEIRSPFKNYKTAPQLIKTNKKPNKNDVKTTPFFWKNQPFRIGFQFHEEKTNHCILQQNNNIFEIKCKSKTDHEDPLLYGLQTRKDLQLFFIYFQTVFNRKFYIKQATFPILSLDGSVQDDFIILAELLWCINFLLLVWLLCKIPNFRQRSQNQWIMRPVWCLWNPKFPNISNRKRCFPTTVWKHQMIFQTRTMFLFNPCSPCFVVVNLRIKRFFFWNQFFIMQPHVTKSCLLMNKRFWFHRRTFLLMLLRFTLNSNKAVF